MTDVTAAAPARAALPFFQFSWWLGLALVGSIALLGIAIANIQWASQLSLSALTLAIVLGIVAGNTFFPAIAIHTSIGVDFSKSILLRAGIILYGFRITFQQISEVGWTGVIIAIVIVITTFTLAVQLGTRVFKLDRQTSMLIGAGSSICGAAAVLAAESVVRGQSHKVSIAVATVVVFGTLSMFLYPVLYPYLGLTEQAFGVFIGSTVHEVAQVVAAGKAVSDAAAGTAVIEKMLRVMMLAPFLILLSGMQRTSSHHANVDSNSPKARFTIPWFAVWFIVASAINSMQILPDQIITILIQIDTALLAMAMAALGLRTHVGSIRQAGLKPLLLAASLFIFLIVGGYGINIIITRWLG